MEPNNDKYLFPVFENMMFKEGEAKIDSRSQIYFVKFINLSMIQFKTTLADNNGNYCQNKTKDMNFSNWRHNFTQ